MSHARHTLRIPDAVREDLAGKQEDQPLWYVGGLQSENGRDIESEALPDGEIVAGARKAPRKVKPSGKHPGKALKKSR